METLDRNDDGKTRSGSISLDWKLQMALDGNESDLPAQQRDGLLYSRTTGPIEDALLRN